MAPDPLNVVFFSEYWEPIGNRRELCDAIHKASKIDIDILEGTNFVETASIAQRMSWAANRETTRPEDWAYCLMGLFSVNMPMLYGEGGRKAFLRLQEEIMRNSDDHSIFAWVNQDIADPSTAHGLLADSPAAFSYPEVSSIITYSPWEEQSAYAMTNRGLDIQLHLTPIPNQDGEFAAALDCPHPQTYSGFLAIRLKKISQEGEQFVRVDCHNFTAVRERGQLTSIFVPQHMPDTSRARRETVYPLHMFLLRTTDSTYLPMNDECRNQFDTSDQRLLGTMPDRAFKIMKKERQWAAAIHFGRSGAGNGIVVILGTQGRLEVGFAVVETDRFDADQVYDMKENFDPESSGTTVHLRHHDVRVDMPAHSRRGVKIYEVYVTIRDQVDGQLSPREPLVKAGAFAKVVSRPTPTQSEQPKRRDMVFRALGVRR